VICRQRLELAAAGPRHAASRPHRSAHRFSPASADQGRDGWLSDLLNRGRYRPGAQEPPRGRPPQQAASDNPLASLSLDIGRLMDRNLAAEMWDRYQRGGEQALHQAALHPGGPEGLRRKSRANIAPTATSSRRFDRYITEFERLLDEAAPR